MYFDFHTHPSFKAYLSDYRPNCRGSCWDYLESPFGIARSQSNLQQMKEGGIRLAVACLYTMERPLTASFLIQHLVPKITVLDEQMLHHPGYADSKDRLQGEMEHLIKSANHNPDGGQAFKLLNSIDEMDDSQLNVILAIEGSHCLESFNGSLLDNLRALKQGPYRFLYLTFTHMIQYPLCTHAYGMKLIKSNDQFKPSGFGLTDLGKQVIDEAYDENHGPRLLLDIKHMSVVARQQFYAYRREKGYEDIPILATHMGVTGISRSPMAISQYFGEPLVRRDDFIEVLYDRPQGIGRGLFDKTHFNPWSINLYDEDIVEILDSGGLIGLNLDQRILGAERVSGEYFSAEEFAFILNDYQMPEEVEPVPEGEFIDEPLEVRKLNERKHVRHLCNNILHIVKVGGERAWQHLCIGCDFDGLINPINTCTSALEFPKLEQELIDTLPEMMAEDDSHTYDSSDMPGKVKGIMYDNGLAFLRQHFS